MRRAKTSTAAEVEGVDGDEGTVNGAIADKSFFLLRVISPHSYCPLSERQVDADGTTTPPGTR